MSSPMRLAPRANRGAGSRALARRACRRSLRERLAEAVDGPQRRAQVVRDRVAERLELLVLALELGDQSGARLGQLARRALLAAYELVSQQLLADAPVLVLELLAADLGAHARP